MIKLLGQLLGMIIGSAITPWWPLLCSILQNYFNLQRAVLGPQPFIQELRHFCTMVEAYPNEVLFSLIPAMVAIMVFGIVMMSLFSYLGGHFAQQAVTYMNQRLVRSKASTT